MSSAPSFSRASTVSQWLSALEKPTLVPSLRTAYGDRPILLRERAALLRETLEAYRVRFGDTPVRVFRAPGRVNVRGMHVDTHGGWLNLMTHQREVTLIAGPSGSDGNFLANVAADFAPMEFSLSEELAGASPDEDWHALISRPEIRARVSRRTTAPGMGWRNYLVGAALRTQWQYPDVSLSGLNIMVHSDLPRGAALSSSAALSLAALLAFAHCNSCIPSPEPLIAAEQDVEWYAGARVGMSDQTAILLGRQYALLHIALFAEDFSLESAQYLPFPDALDLLVVNSYTTRNLSGPQRLQYALNRFAYSMAIPIVRAELLRNGHAPGHVERMDRLARMTADAFGGVAALYRLLKGVPENMAIKTLREHYRLPMLDEAYARYFDGLPREQQPTTVPLRGPLLFGMAESERARVFPELLRTGDYARAGALMTIGHDGDRVRARDGARFNPDISDATLETLARCASPLEQQSGAYGASSPALDMVVDAALDAGALGASLTGAGIAGAVLVLCRKSDSARITRAVWDRLRREDYASLAGLTGPLSDNEIHKAVVANQATAGACELTLTP